MSLKLREMVRGIRSCKTLSDVKRFPNKIIKFEIFENLIFKEINLILTFYNLKVRNNFHGK